MKEWECDLLNPQATASLGFRIGTHLRGGDVVAMTGMLGAGKTTMIRAIGQELGADDMASPSFGIVHEHSVAMGRFLHVDAWRLKGKEDLMALGWDEWAGSPDVILCIEWADRIAGALDEFNPLMVNLQHTENGRTAVLQWEDASRLASLASSGAAP